ncbi:hypothetical protein [Amazonocrinis nigriterrae]|uniref:hypothetical protein n=1 Tax=Amazonocrinis nigriterrae TaxID=2840443 RepID=UPI001CECF036|nr:hypothetical protein [Amazonocrinis nigriterrae]
MLTLQNQRLATELFNWKRENAQFLLQLQQEAINRPLRSRQFLAETPTPTEMPEAIDDWFSKLELLQGVPFNYLVPDERLLPTESIRFFWVDSFWVDCLQDGAFSVGRVTAAESEQDKKIRSLPASKTLSQEQPLITGLILRSQVVSGWPNLLIDGYDAVVDSEDFVAPSEAQLLELLRMEKLAKDVLICLFKGEVKTVDIHLQPEAMHFGLDIKNEATNEFWQILRNANGEEMDGDPNPLVAVDPIPWSHQEKGVIDIKALVEEMKKKKDELNLGDDPFTSAQFALQMIEGVQKVRFTWEQGQ